MTVLGKRSPDVPSGAPTVQIVAAMDEGGAIGRGGGLPWHLPDELAGFKDATWGFPVLMGRRTAQSLGRALPGRRNLVLTSADQAPHAAMEAFATLDDALLAVRDCPSVAVIGGSSVYAATLPLATSLRLTHVRARVEAADCWFPPFDAADWEPVARHSHPADDRHAFAFDVVTYRRVSGRSPGPPRR